ncbi:hypothetical protein GCM10011403_06960 [Pseudohongiella nitratireducens]|jgi:hypothetical protein|uniref:Lipoprotein n=1 Tax=Pseudohongiella nitratireducens TaxID=1768907 RepID=A0A917LS39_9GAMM|nr:hypothetical protein [Pseudohongiella nitratireducens]GGG52416.1 hypothetical protein GCM10011403_06960 [Pseudohongiella nitratireducens]|tara:strand:- start:729 stop:1688 length:960 start_codon:yes stop_codon:yes gene_type:complete
MENNVLRTIKNTVNALNLLPLVVIGSLAGLAACAPDNMSAQTGDAMEAADTDMNSDGGIPRRVDGKPDMNGIWQVMSNANNNLEPAAPKSAFALVPGDFVPVPAPEVVAMGAVGAVPASQGVITTNDGYIPYKPEALAQRDENRENWLTSDPEIKCFMPGVPRATYLPHPFQIFQSDSAFFIAYSFAGAVRNVFLEDPGEPPLDSWMGQSYGYWEGDTFVVEVTGLLDSTWYDRAGNYRSWESTVVERYTMTGENVIQYEATITDPQLYTEPWTISMPIYRRLEEGFELPQFKCVEFVEELMYGSFRKGEPIEDMRMPF